MAFFLPKIGLIIVYLCRT